MSDSTVLCVDPDESARAAARQALTSAGYAVETCASAERALQLLDEGAYACVVTEYDLPETTGLQLIDRVRDHSPDAACILFTDVAPETVDTSQFDSGVTEFLAKDDPEAYDQLGDLVRVGIEHRTQTAYPLADDEPDRLAALERYASADLESSFDRLTRLAGALFDVPQSAIGVIDEREQRFLGCYGVSFDALPRQATVCTYAILDEDVTVIEDVHDDPRFAESDELDEAGIRFYASANVTSADEHVLGTFCVYDTQPRAFDGDQREHLQLFADEAAARLEQHRAAQHSRDPSEEP